MELPATAGDPPRAAHEAVGTLGMWKLLPGALLGVLILLGAAPAVAQCTPAGCDDGNPCTDDICDPTLGCRHFNNSGSCTDGNSCTTNDVCNQGACVGGPPAAGCS